MSDNQPNPQDSSSQPNNNQEATPSSEANVSSNPDPEGTSSEASEKPSEKDEFDAIKKASDYLSEGIWSEEDIEWEIEELKKKKEALKETLSKHEHKLRLLEDDMITFATGTIPVHLRIQVMAEKENIQTRQKELKECLEKLGAKKKEYQEYRDKLSNKEEQEQFKNLSGKMRGVGKETELEHVNWFTKLNDRDKLYAITLSMFNGLTYSTFYNIYEIVLEVTQAKKKDEEKEDIGFNFDFTDPDFAQIKSADDSPQEIIEFIEEKYVTEVFGMMRQRYRSILLNFLPLLKQIVEKYPDWQVRVRAALAVAEIGKTNFEQIKEQVLIPWAGDSRAYVRTSVGYVLAYLAEEETYQPQVKQLLTDWVDTPPGREKGETWRYRWTAASTYKQIGMIESAWAKDVTYQGLTELARFNDIRIVDSVVHSLVVLSLQGQLTNILDILQKWVNQDEDDKQDDQVAKTRGITGILTFIILSKIHVNLISDDDDEAGDNTGVQVDDLFDLIRQSEAEQGDYWQLTVEVGVFALEQQLAESFFSLLMRWTQYAATDPRMQNTVRNLIVDVFVQVSPRRREQILHRLTRWQRQTRDEHLAEMATSAKIKIKARMLDEPLATT